MLPRSRFPRERDLNEREGEGGRGERRLANDFPLRGRTLVDFVFVRQGGRTSRLFRIVCGGEEVSEKRCSLNAALLCKMRFQTWKGSSVFLEKINSLPWFLYNYVREGRGMFVFLFPFYF